MSARQRDCGHLVVVDDDETLRSFVVEILQEAGYTVAETGCGRQALELIRAEQPDLVVLDVRLPVLSGYEVCKRIRDEHGSAPKILFVSGERTDSLDRVAGLLLGGDDYLVKPFESHELLARTRRLVSRAEGERQHGANLTPRELEVLELLAAGFGQAEIARRLVISPKTVGTHIERILAKLGAHSRAEAVGLAYRLQLVAVRA